MNKVIFLDFSIFLHRAAYSLRKNPKIPATYNAMNMIISCLLRIGVNEDDIIIVALDARNAWRKDYEKTYKGQRKEQREKSGLDWDNLFKDFDWLVNILDKSTNFNMVKVFRCEADDVMAVGCRYFKDREVILVTYDSDLEQMWAYDNVKIFSPHPKKKTYKLKPNNFNPYNLLAKKIKKETADGLNAEVETEREYNNRLLCVNLLSLPDEIENKIIQEFDRLPIKYPNIDLFPFSTLKDRFLKIYNSDKIITYENAVKKEANKKAKKAKLKKKLTKK